jgi:glucose-1-phosphate thymidylyltransferase
MRTFHAVLKNGKDLGIKRLGFAYQEGEGGISEALSLAEDFVGGDSTCVILGDNCTDADISHEVKTFSDGALIFFRKVKNPQRFGVAVFNKKSKIVKIEEKPKKTKSNLAQTGLYIYDKTVFDRIGTLKPSTRGELEVTDLNNTYLKDGKFNWAELKGFWSRRRHI